MATYDFTQLDIEKQPVIGAADVQWNRADSATFDGTRVMASADVGKILGSKRASTVFVVLEGSAAMSNRWILKAKSGNSVFGFLVTQSGGFNVLAASQTDSAGTASGYIFKTANADSAPLSKTIVCFRNKGVVNGADGGASLFINGTTSPGTDVDWNTTTVVDVELDTAITYFGDQDNNGTDAFTGSFPCAPIIFDRALSDSEIETAFESLWKTYGVGCWSYDGSTSVTTVTNHADMDLPDGDWTVSVWAKWASDTGADANAIHPVFGIGNYGSSGSINLYALDSANVNASKLRLFFTDDGSDDSGIVSTNAVSDSREWQHIAIIRSGETVTLYVDGVSEGTCAAVDAMSFSASLLLGQRASVTDLLDGYLRDFAIWNSRALDPPTELAALAAGEYAADATGGAPDVNIVMLPDYATNNPTYITQGFTPAGLQIANTAVTGTRQA